MAQCSVSLIQDLNSNDNSVSTKEFLHIEKTCETYKDSDEEIKMLFNEINKLSGGKGEKLIGDDEDVELILKRAEDIAQETENLLKKSPVGVSVSSFKDSTVVPLIKVTKANETELNIDETAGTGSGKVRDEIRRYFFIFVTILLITDVA